MKKRTKQKAPAKRRASRLAGFVGLALAVALTIAGEWYVHHPRAWLNEKDSAWPKFVTSTLLTFGNPAADLTDGLGLTGHDVVYEYDEEAPVGRITFAGVPRRIGAPAPADIRIIDRGEFLIGWSDSKKHPIWCAYHVPREVRFEDGKRPSFRQDREVKTAPHPDDYTHSGFDRGHMVPNHAIISRFGEEMRRKTFLTSNIAPQRAELNRGVWRELEHRIADLWTARYGEIWVIVGCLCSESGQVLSHSPIDVPDQFYQLIMAQEGMDVRALAVLIPQYTGWGTWAARHIISIDELETLTGLDFNPNLPSFIQDPLEAELPTRLWPVNPGDIFRLIAYRVN